MTKLLRGTVWGGASLLALMSMAACGTPASAGQGTHFVTARNVAWAHKPQAKRLPAKRSPAPTAPSFTAAERAITPGSITRIGGGTAPAIAADLAQPVSLADTYLYGAPSTTVVIAPSGTTWADEYAVLAANPLAYADHAPILLSLSPTALGPSTVGAINRLHAKVAILVGPDNTPALRKQLMAHHLHVQGIGNGNPVVTGTAIARALLGATGQSSFSNIFVVAPSSAAQDVTITSPADSLTSPILVTTPPNAAGQASLPAPEAPLAAQATTVYTIGALGQGTVTNLPSTANVVALGMADPWVTANQVDFHFFYTAWTPEIVNVSPANLTADLAAGPMAAANVAPLIPFTGTVIATPVAQFLQTLAHGSLTPVAIGNAAVVPPVVVKDVTDVVGGTVYATLDAQNLAYYDRIGKLYHGAVPQAPAIGLEALNITLGTMNNAAILKQYGGPKVPVSLKAVGVRPHVPSNGAIIGLTPSVTTRLVQEGSSVPAVGGQLTPPEIIAATRMAARALINSADRSLPNLPNTFIDNPEAPSFVAIRPHTYMSVKEWVSNQRDSMPHRWWVYRAWVDMSHATISAYTPSGSPNTVIAGLTVSHLTLHIIESGVANNRLEIFQDTMTGVSPISLDLIQANLATVRWYNDNFESGNWQTKLPITVYWSEAIH
ncbi:MAG: hypothetical protein M0Z36_06735 [Thermaerobacter sp.]|nr:hypothetical protein [Thermaerobacter sp.]